MTARAATDALTEPWRDDDFRADLRAYAEGGSALSRQYARDAVLLARMAGRVPRAAWDTRGATAWTSFLAEVAVSRRTSTQLAGLLVTDAQQLVRLMPCSLALLQDGRLPVAHARALIEAVRPLDDELVRRIDRELAERSCTLVPSRIRAAADRIAVQHDADAAAARAAASATRRGVRLTPLPDAQADLALTGPATVLAQVDAALRSDAQAWRAALRDSGDTRGIAQLTFDLAVQRLLAGHVVAHRPSSTTADSDDRSPSGGLADSTDVAEPADAPPASGPGPCCLPDPSSPSWWTDRRFSRAARLDISVPVTTALGLSQEPGWLPGHGWISAPQVRQLLPVAELRQVCVAADSEPDAGRVVDVAPRPVRPPRTPDGARRALLGMAREPFDITDPSWRVEEEHDPSDALSAFTRARSISCDGPWGATPLASSRCDLDHHERYDAEGDDRPPAASPVEQTDAGATAAAAAAAALRAAVPTAVHGDIALHVDVASGWLTMSDLGHEDAVPPPRAPGVTAAYNLVPRSRRAHGLKHRGWTPLRTASSTWWWSPAGQVVEVPADLRPVPAPAAGAVLDCARDLHDREALLLARARSAADSLADLYDPACAPAAADLGAADVDVAEPAAGPGHESAAAVDDVEPDW